MEKQDALIIKPSMFNLPEVEERVIIFFSIRHFYMFQKLTGGSEVDSFGPFKSCVCRSGGREVTALGGMIGAPLAAIAMENAIAGGGKSFLGFGTCGWLNAEERETGELIAPRKGVDETGMIKDYGGSDDTVKLNCHPGLPVCRAVVSVNSFYRLSENKVREYRRRQIDLIDMEAAPLSRIASISGASYQPIFVISDRVSANFRWHNGSMKEKKKFSEGLKKGLELLSSTDFG